MKTFSQYLKVLLILVSIFAGQLKSQDFLESFAKEIEVFNNKLTSTIDDLNKGILSISITISNSTNLKCEIDNNEKSIEKKASNTPEYKESDVQTRRIDNVIDNIERPKEETSISSKFDLIKPLNGRHKITCGYGYRRDPFTNKLRFHEGVDLAATRGTIVLAIEKGKVLKTGYSKTYGHYVEIEHPNMICSKYAHLSKVLVSEGELISKNDIIGKVGNTGRSTGPHLHFELIKKGNHIDPTKLIKF